VLSECHLRAYTTLTPDGGVGTSGNPSSVKISVKALPGMFFKRHRRKCNVHFINSHLTILTCKFHLGWTLDVVSFLGCLRNFLCTAGYICLWYHHRYRDMDFE
jgi:hypothetical protein